MGNLSYQRNYQLVAIGRALKQIDLEGIPKYIDVYSGEKRTDVLKILTEENGIHFHGMISNTEIEKVMENSMVVIHTESFDKEIKNRTKFSVSTKIAELLTKGPCILAYGPQGIASIDYLKKNNAAFVISSEKNLVNDLKNFFSDREMREEIIKNARLLSQKNHNAKKNANFLKEQLEQVIKEKYNESIANK